MNKIMPKVLRTEFLRFLMTGGIAALVNIFVCYILTSLVGYGFSIFIAFLCGVTTAWALARFFVFSPSNTMIFREYIRFFIVNIFSLFQIWFISIGLNNYFFPSINFYYCSDTIAHFIGVIFPVIPSYFGHKYLTFKTKRATTISNLT